MADIVAEYLAYVAGYKQGKADVKPVVRGEWIKKDDGVCWWWECSNCGERPLRRYKTDVLSNFCPNCGADMRGEDDG